VLIGGSNSLATLWDAATGGKIKSFSGHTGQILSVAFSPNGQQLLTGSVDATAILWNPSTGGIIRAFAGHTCAVTSVAFGPDGSQLATGSADGTTRVWSTETGHELAQLVSVNAGKDWLVTTPDGFFECSAGGRKFIRYRDPKDPMKVLPVEQGFEAYYHPNLLADILAGHAVAPAVKPAVEKSRVR
jgi:WD40 repeat protein